MRKDLGHSWHKVEGCFSAKRYIILDDFIDSGSTINETNSSINTAFSDKNTPILVAIVLYAGRKSQTFFFKAMCRNICDKIVLVPERIRNVRS